MSKIMVFQHVPHEPLGELNTLIREHRHRIRYVNFWRDPEVIPSIEGYQALIILGGPMNVDEIDKHPFLETELNVIREAIELDIPILGICLGAQLMAKALGGHVYPAATKEIGWYPLHTTSNGLNDNLIQHFQSLQMIFQWHGYTFDLPDDPKVDVLVRGEHCANQAFRYGKQAYGFQFHLEVDRPLIDRWLSLPIHEAELNSNDPEQHRAIIRQETQKYLSHSQSLADKIFSAFLDLIPRVDRHVILKHDIE